MSWLISLCGKTPELGTTKLSQEPQPWLMHVAIISQTVTAFNRVEERWAIEAKL
jgi:hypothetical protein